MFKRNIFLLVLFFLYLSVSGLLIAADGQAEAIGRESYFFSKNTVSTTSEPSTLQFYEFHENLSDEIVIDVYKQKDLSNLEGKRIFIGYGVVDPTGDDCKVFTPDVTGYENNITICLPWWRVERTYSMSNSQGSGVNFQQFISRMQRPRPPKTVNVCNQWAASQELPGGTVTCTTYYDKTIDSDCYNNPVQPRCFKNNCGAWVTQNCEQNGNSIGHEVESLQNVQLNSGGMPETYESRVNLVTRQFTCPGGSFTQYSDCLDTRTVNMHPYECKPDDPTTPLDDSIMKYCDENRPVRDAATGAVTGFLGTCPAEASGNGQPFEVTCRVDSFSQTRNTCVRYAPNSIVAGSEPVNQSYDLDYTEYTVMSGTPDIYASKENCLKATRDRVPAIHTTANPIDGGTSISCSSHNYIYFECTVSNFLISDIAVMHRASVAGCSLGTSYGIKDDHTIWVDHGCRATFSLNGSTCPIQYTFDTSYSFCNADNPSCPDGYVYDEINTNCEGGDRYHCYNEPAIKAPY